MEPETTNTQAIRGLSRTLGKLREPRFGFLEVGIMVAIVIMLIAGMFTIATVIRQQRDIARTARNTNQLVLDMKDLLGRVQNAIDAAPGQTDRLLERFAEELRRQIAAHDQRTDQVVIRQGKTNTIVVVVTPQPQPTATVTCRPSIISGRCR